MNLVLLLALSLGAASAEPAIADAEIVRLILKNFAEPPLSDKQKEAIKRFVSEADPAHKLILPDFLTQHLDAAAKQRYLKAVPENSPASADFYERTVAGLNAALGDRGYGMPLTPLLEPDPLPPELDTPHIRLMAKAMDVKDPRERVGIYTKAISAIGDLDLRLSSPLAHYERALAYFELHEIERAFDDLSADLSLYPKHPEGLFNRAVAAVMLGRWKEGVRDAESFLALLPRYPPAYLIRASALTELGDHASALRDYDRAVELDPDYILARHSRGTELALRGRPEDALDDFNAAIQLSTGSPMGYEGLGFTYLDLNRNEGAAQAFSESIRLDPGNPGTHAGLAVSLLRRGDGAAAGSAYARAVALDPLFDISAASVTLNGRRWTAGPEGELLQTYSFTPRTAADIDALIRLRRRQGIVLTP